MAGRADGLEQPRRCPGRSSSAGSSGLPGAGRRTGLAAQAPPTEVRADRATRRPVTPYAELHCHSHFSFLDGASLAGRAGRGGGAPGPARASRSPTTTASTARRCWPRRRAATTTCRTVFGAELSLGPQRPAERRARPRGQPPAGAGARRRGLPPARRGDDRRPPARRREGPPRLRPRRAGRAGPRALGGADRLPQGDGPRRRWPTAASRPAAEALDRLTSLFGLEHVARRAVATAPGADETNASLAGLAGVHGLDVVAAGNVHHATPARHRLASAMAAVRARRSLAELDGWLDLSGSAHLRSGAEMAAALPPYPGRRGRAASLLADELAFDLRKASPRLPKRQIPEGHTADSWLRVLARARLRRAVRRRPARARRRASGSSTSCASIAEKDFAGYFVIVHDIVAFAREPRDPLPGPGLRGQLGGLLRPRHHRGRRGLLPAAVRAVHLRAPRRGARHRRRLRLRPARGGHPVGLRHLRPPQRRPGGQRHRLPAADGGARRRQGARLLPRPAGRLVQADRRLEVGGRRRPGRPDAHDVPAPVVALAEELMRRPAPPRHPLRRDGAHRAAHRRGLPHRARRGWTGARCCSGTRTPASRWGWSSSTCSAWACSARSTT